MEKITIPKFRIPYHELCESCVEILKQRRREYYRYYKRIKEEEYRRKRKKIV